MWRFRLFGFPVTVQPFFWLVCFLLSGGLGMLQTKDWAPVLQWMAVIFVSILVHELGHAFAGRRCGASAEIVLHSFGGTTALSRGTYSRREAIMVSAAGPACSLLLAILCWGINLLLAFLPFVVPLPGENLLSLLTAIKGIAWSGLWINAVWTVFNLLPVLPMDGGQILRDALGSRHFRLACWIGFGTAVLVGGLAAYFGWYIATILLLYMGFLNYKGTILAGGVER